MLSAPGKTPKVYFLDTALAACVNPPSAFSFFVMNDKKYPNYFLRRTRFVHGKEYNINKETRSTRIHRVQNLVDATFCSEVVNLNIVLNKNGVGLGG